MIEILLVVSILAFLTLFSLPFYLRFMQTNDMSIAEQMVKQQINRAQVLAISGEGDSGWSVHVGSGTVTVYKGASYTSRDTSFDEVVSLPGGVTISATTDLTFAKLTGIAATTNTIQLQQASSGLSSSLIPNSYGTVQKN